MEDVIYAEEISHCAAGVRWLRHLHTLAHSMGSAAQQAQQGESEAAAAAGATAALERLEVGGVEGACQGAAAAAGGEACAACSRGGAAASCEAQPGGVPDWAVEARRYPTVELWFHALIRKHFR